MPAYLKTLGDTATGLLVETRAGDAGTLARQVEEVLGLLSEIPTIYPAAFTEQKAECEKLWNIRKGLFPAVGAARQIGTTVVIEDVVFPIEALADARITSYNVCYTKLLRLWCFPEYLWKTINSAFWQRVALAAVMRNNFV